MRRLVRWVQNRSPITKGLLVIGIPAAALLGSLLAFSLTLRGLGQAEAAVRQAILVRHEITGALGQVDHAHSAILTHLLTGEAASFVHHREAREAVRGAIARLERLEQDDLPRVAGLRTMVTEQFTRLDRLMAAGRLPGPPGLLAEIHAGMDAIRDYLWAWERDENEELIAHRARLDRTLHIASGVVLASLVAGVGGGIPLAFLLAAGIVHRTRRLQENTRRLAQRLPLLPVPPLSDEIGLTAQSLDEAAALLGETDRGLRESEAKFRFLVSASPAVIYTARAHGDYAATFISEKVKALVGHDCVEFLQEPGFWARHIHPEDAPRIFTDLSRLFETGRHAHEYRFAHKDGSYRWVYDEMVLIRDDAGAPQEIVGYWIDITKRRDAMEILRQAREEAERARGEAEEAGRARSRLLSRMSHELRTPMNAILGFAQLMEMNGLTTEQRAHTGEIVRAGRRLLRLIDAALEVNRMDAGSVALSLEPVAVREVVEEALDLVRPLAAQQHVSLVDAVAEDEARCVLADKQRLKQVLHHLLTNAVTFNRPEGSATVACTQAPGGRPRIAGAPALGERLRITVADTGPGIRPEAMGSLFGAFERLDAEERGISGIGLGLVTSKRLVEVMGGTIGLESTPGLGSTFWVEFPLAHLGPGRAMVVLYIEDEPSNIRVVEGIVAKRPGTTLLVAMNGETGLDLARQHPPDVILLGLALPDLPGDEILRRLKADPATSAIPVLVLASAHRTPDEIRQLIEMGARTCLVKPLDLLRLLLLLDDVLEGQQDAW